MSEELLSWDEMGTEIKTFKADMNKMKNHMEKSSNDEKERKEMDTPKQAALRAALDEKEPDKREMAMKKAMDMPDEEDEDKTKSGMKSKKANSMKHKKMSPNMMAAIMAAAEEDDPEKRKTKMAKAVAAADDETDEDEEKTEMKAELSALRQEVSTPKLTYLASVYKNSNVSKEHFVELVASWKNMSIPELDAEIKRVEPFAHVNANASIHNENKPISSSKSMFDFGASTNKASSKMAEIDDASPLDLFNGGIA